MPSKFDFIDNIQLVPETALDGSAIAVYDTTDSLPVTANTSQLAFVRSDTSLYIYDGKWYSLTLDTGPVPSFTSVPNSIVDARNETTFTGSFSANVSGNGTILYAITPVSNITSSSITVNSTTGAYSITSETDSFSVSFNASVVTGSVNKTVLYSRNPLLDSTGGTITRYDTYQVHTFTSSGTFIPNANANIDLLVVGGGGGGGKYGGGGGGAGGYRTFSNIAVTANTSYNVTIGTGGGGSTGFSNRGFNGTSSSFGDSGLYVSAGGGGGASRLDTANAAAGGSGGGASSYISAINASGNLGGAGNTPATTPVQGYAGGAGVNTANTASGCGAGGGGSAGIGFSGRAGTFSLVNISNGGPGTLNSISGNATIYAAGGGGGVVINTPANELLYETPGYGGSGIGGNGGGLTSNATNGTPNTGSGGGGGGNIGNGGNGGSGIVIVRFSVT